MQSCLGIKEASKKGGAIYECGWIMARHSPQKKVLKYICILEQHMLPSIQSLFQGRPCLFQQNNAKPDSAHITSMWLHSKRVQVLNLSPINKYAVL